MTLCLSLGKKNRQTGYPLNLRHFKLVEDGLPSQNIQNGVVADETYFTGCLGLSA